MVTKYEFEMKKRELIQSHMEYIDAMELFKVSEIDNLILLEKLSALRTKIVFRESEFATALIDV